MKITDSNYQYYSIVLNAVHDDILSHNGGNNLQIISFDVDVHRKKVLVSYLPYSSSDEYEFELGLRRKPKPQIVEFGGEIYNICESPIRKIQILEHKVQ